jgi:hypothetical protein
MLVFQAKTHTTLTVVEFGKYRGEHRL